jgi:hypothetical protein
MVCTVVSGFLAFVPRLSAQSAAKSVILISVMDSDRHPLADVMIEGRSDSTLLCKAITDAHGLATLSGCGSAAGLRLMASLVGYFPATAGVPLQDRPVIDISLSKKILVQTTEVQA